MEHDYDVCLHYSSRINVTVKADNARQAKERALEKANAMNEKEFADELLASIESDLELSTADEVKDVPLK